MKKKILVLSIIFMLIISFLSVKINAASTYSFTPSMTASNSKVKAGSEVLITVKLSNLNVGDAGINSFTAYLSYDKEVFEDLTDSSVDGVNGWRPSYTPGTGKVSLIRPTFLKTDEEIMQISLKTKADLEEGTQGEVKLTTIIVSNTTDEMTASPISTSITIENESDGTSTPVPIISNTNTTNNVGVIQLNTNTISNNTVKNTNNTNNTTNLTNSTLLITNNNVSSNGIQVINNNTSSESDIPYTGTETEALARIIIGVICIGLVLYIKIERMDKDIK